MESVKAFVGHSFSKSDEVVVKIFLNYLSRVHDLLPQFSWQHAEDPEPRGIDSKVLAMLEGQNLFIGICTRKERVISEDNLVDGGWFNKGSLSGKVADFQWKTSDWIIQEIGLAVGRDMDVILLLEKGTRPPGGIQGSLEFIEFDRGAPEKCFERLMAMIAALTPRSVGVASIAQEAQIVESLDNVSESSAAESDWSKPQEGWDKKKYRLAYRYSILTDDLEIANEISSSFLGSKLCNSDAEKWRWLATTEFLKARFHRGVELSTFRELLLASDNDCEVAESFARTLLIYEDFTGAMEAFDVAAKSASSASRKIELLTEAAISSAKAGGEDELNSRMRKIHELGDSTQEIEALIVSAEMRLAEIRKEDGLVLGALERLLEIDPSNSDERFSIAQKYSSLGLYGLSAMHYQKIPSGARSAAVWNNIGVALDRLNLPTMSVRAYRRSEELGETLALSNLAVKLLGAGFLAEAQTLLDKALQQENYHQNIGSTLATAKSVLDSEEAEQRIIFDKVKPTSSFYRGFGRALSKNCPDISGTWKSHACNIEFVTSSDGSITATGAYTQTNIGLWNAFSLGGADSSAPEENRYAIEYRGYIRGRTVVGTFSRNRVGEKLPRSSLLTAASKTPSPMLMWVDDLGTTIHVVENIKSADPDFYTLQRL